MAFYCRNGGVDEQRRQAGKDAVSRFNIHPADH